MKKIIFFIFLLFFFWIFKVEGKSDFNFQDTIIKFPYIEGYGLQGFTTTDRYLFMVMIKDDESDSIIRIYDLENFMLYKEIKFGTLGHANDVTFNSKNGFVYVLGSSGTTIVYSFNERFDYVGSFKIPLPARSISYIPTEDSYAIRTVSTGFILNHQFKLENKFPFIVGMNINSAIGRQGWSYYNGYLYYANWSWKRLGGDGSNFLYVYDRKGKNVASYYTDDTIGEMEDVAFYKEKMVLGFNGYDGYVKFYMMDIPKIESVKETEEQVEIETMELIEKETKMKNYLLLGCVIILLFIFFVIFLKYKKT